MSFSLSTAKSTNPYLTAEPETPPGYGFPAHDATVDPEDLANIPAVVVAIEDVPGSKPVDSMDALSDAIFGKFGGHDKGNPLDGVGSSIPGGMSSMQDIIDAANGGGFGDTGGDPFNQPQHKGAGGGDFSLGGGLNGASAMEGMGGGWVRNTSDPANGVEEKLEIHLRDGRVVHTDRGNEPGGSIHVNQGERIVSTETIVSIDGKTVTTIVTKGHVDKHGQLVEDSHKTTVQPAPPKPNTEGSGTTSSEGDGDGGGGIDGGKHTPNLGERGDNFISDGIHGLHDKVIGSAGTPGGLSDDQGSGGRVATLNDLIKASGGKVPGGEVDPNTPQGGGEDGGTGTHGSDIVPPHNYNDGQVGHLPDWVIVCGAPSAGMSAGSDLALADTMQAAENNAPDVANMHAGFTELHIHDHATLAAIDAHLFH